MASAVLWLSLLALPASAEPPQVAPEVTLSGLVVGTVEITVPDGVKIGYQPTFKDTELTFLELVAKKGKRAFLLQAKPDASGTVKSGNYAIVWWTVGEDVGSTTSVTVKGTNPTPPAPVPPTPVPPTPVPPDQQSELAKTFQAAYNTSKDAEGLKLFQAAMDAAVKSCQTSPDTTVAALVKRINGDTKATLGGKVQVMFPLGDAVGKHLGKSLPADDGPLNQDLRAVFINAYTEVATAVKQLKP